MESLQQDNRSSQDHPSSSHITPILGRRAMKENKEDAARKRKAGESSQETNENARKRSKKSASLELLESPGPSRKNGGGNNKSNKAKSKGISINGTNTPPRTAAPPRSYRDLPTLPKAQRRPRHKFPGYVILVEGEDPGSTAAMRGHTSAVVKGRPNRQPSSNVEVPMGPVTDKEKEKKRENGVTEKHAGVKNGNQRKGAEIGKGFMTILEGTEAEEVDDLPDADGMFSNHLHTNLPNAQAGPGPGTIAAKDKHRAVPRSTSKLKSTLRSPTSKPTRPHQSYVPIPPKRSNFSNPLIQLDQEGDESLDEMDVIARGGSFHQKDSSSGKANEGEDLGEGLREGAKSRLDLGEERWAMIDAVPDSIGSSPHDNIDDADDEEDLRVVDTAGQARVVSRNNNDPKGQGQGQSQWQLQPDGRTKRAPPIFATSSHPCSSDPKSPIAIPYPTQSSQDISPPTSSPASVISALPTRKTRVVATAKNKSETQTQKGVEWQGRTTPKKVVRCDSEEEECDEMGDNHGEEVIQDFDEAKSAPTNDAVSPPEMVPKKSRPGPRLRTRASRKKSEEPDNDAEPVKIKTPQQKHKVQDSLLGGASQFAMVDLHAMLSTQARGYVPKSSQGGEDEGIDTWKNGDGMDTDESGDGNPLGGEEMDSDDGIIPDRPTKQLDKLVAKRYLMRFKGERRCPFCSERLPKHPSLELRELLATSEEQAKREGPLEWTRTIAVCDRHSAESNIWPLGLRAGYPRRLDIADLEKRLLEPHCIKRVYKLATLAQKSAFFLKIKSDVDDVGKTKWAGNAFQEREAMLEILRPGYFGEAGRHCIETYLNALFLDRNILLPSDVHPLNVAEYLHHVLTIEVAIKLIREDMQGDEAGVGGRAAALAILNESKEYGRTRFGVESEWVDGATSETRWMARVRKERDKMDRVSAEEQAGQRRSLSIFIPASPEKPVKKEAIEIDSESDDEIWGNMYELKDEAAFVAEIEVKQEKIEQEYEAKKQFSKPKRPPPVLAVENGLADASTAASASGRISRVSEKQGTTKNDGSAGATSGRRSGPIPLAGKGLQQQRRLGMTGGRILTQ